MKRIPAQRGATGATSMDTTLIDGIPAVVDDDLVPTNGDHSSNGHSTAGYAPNYLRIGPPIPPKGKSGRYVVVAIVIVLLAVLSGLMSVAYITKNSAYAKQAGTIKDLRTTVDSQNAQLGTQTTQIGSLTTQLGTLTTNLKTATDQITALQSHSASAGSQVADLTTAKSTLATCVHDEKSYIFQLVHKGSKTAIAKASSKAGTDCAKANKYLN